MSTAPSPPPSEGRRRAPRIVVVMGVSSSGKSVLGDALAKRLSAPFLDGDQFHPPANKEKMRSGKPLTDADRWPWLETLARALHEAADREETAVGACSALKRVYRDFLIARAAEPILFVHLDGPRDVIAARIAARQHEFMPASLLDSQLATLEPTAPDENALVLSLEEPVEVLVERAAAHLKEMARTG